MGYLLSTSGIKVKSFKKQLNNCIMKNVIKIGFFALAFGLFAVACGGGQTETTGDSTATGAPIDTAAAQVATPAPDSLAGVDTSVVAPADTAAHQ